MKISFVIPFHNEEKNCKRMISQVIDYAQKKKWTFEIIPVDDGSTDRTRDLIKIKARENKNIRPIYKKSDGQNKSNTMGEALKVGTKSARGEIIIWTMGDLADDVNTYGEIVTKLSKGYDLVFGSRYMPGGSRGTLDPLKAFLSSWGTHLARFLFGVPVHDITNAFRGFKKEIFSQIKLDSEGFSISPEFAIKAYLLNMKLGEVPTVYTNRVEGISSFKLYDMTKSYIYLYFKLFFKYRLAKEPFDFALIQSTDEKQ